MQIIDLDKGLNTLDSIKNLTYIVSKDWYWLYNKLEAKISI